MGLGQLIYAVIAGAFVGGGIAVVQSETGLIISKRRHRSA
jgi:hypothetical protein